MKKTVIYVVVFLVISLLAGVVIGMGIGRKGPYGRHLAIGPRYEVRAEAQLIEVLNRRLKLTNEQKEKVKTILEASRADVISAKEQAVSVFKEVREKTNTKIRAILTPVQQAEFDQMVSELKERHARGGFKHPAGPPRSHPPIHTEDQPPLE